MILIINIFSFLDDYVLEMRNKLKFFISNQTFHGVNLLNSQTLRK